MTKLNKVTTGYDDAWKEILTTSLRQFLHLFFPRIHDDIDWKRNYKALDSELQRIVPQAAVGKRVVDKLFRVYRKQGKPAWIYIHLEFQAQRDTKLPERMYIYNCALFLRHKSPILSMVVLGDDKLEWRPTDYTYEFWGGGVRLTFPTVKLLDYRDRMEELKRSANPFSHFLIAHLRTLETKQNPPKRLSYKEEITLEMMEQGLTGDEVFYLFRCIDALMTLPEDLEQTFLNKIQKYQEEKNMPFIAPFEQIARNKGRLEGKEEGIQIGEHRGIKKGIKKGIKEGGCKEAQAALLDILRDRFGKISVSLTKTIKGVEDLAFLRTMRRKAIKAHSLDEMDRLLQEVKKPNRQ